MSTDQGSPQQAPNSNNEKSKYEDVNPPSRSDDDDSRDSDVNINEEELGDESSGESVEVDDGVANVSILVQTSTTEHIPSPTLSQVSSFDDEAFFCKVQYNCC